MQHFRYRRVIDITGIGDRLGPESVIRIGRNTHKSEVERHLSKAVRIVDRFHVVQSANRDPETFKRKIFQRRSIPDDPRAEIVR